jgi:hypothetical protein
MLSWMTIFNITAMSPPPIFDSVLNGVLRARIDKTDDDAKQLLQGAQMLYSCFKDATQQRISNKAY